MQEQNYIDGILNIFKNALLVTFFFFFYQTVLLVEFYYENMLLEFLLGKYIFIFSYCLDFAWKGSLFAH